MTKLNALALLIIVLLSSSLVEALNHDQTDQVPQDNFGEYQVQSCCPASFNIAGEYCVRCG